MNSWVASVNFTQHLPTPGCPHPAELGSLRYGRRERRFVHTARSRRRAASRPRWRLRVGLPDRPWRRFGLLLPTRVPGDPPLLSVSDLGPEGVWHKRGAERASHIA